MTARLTKDGESGKSRVGPRFGPTTGIGAEPDPLLGPNQAKLCVGEEAIIIGTVDRGEPITQVRREWEIVVRRRLNGSGRVSGERARHMPR